MRMSNRNLIKTADINYNAAFTNPLTIRYTTKIRYRLGPYIGCTTAVLPLQEVVKRCKTL